MNIVYIIKNTNTGLLASDKCFTTIKLAMKEINDNSLPHYLYTIEELTLV